MLWFVLERRVVLVAGRNFVDAHAHNYLYLFYGLKRYVME